MIAFGLMSASGAVYGFSGNAGYAAAITVSALFALLLLASILARALRETDG